MQLFSKDAFAFREQFQNLKKVQSICLCGFLWQLTWLSPSSASK